MLRILFFLLMILVSAGMVSSCRKSVLPTTVGGNRIPQPIPDPQNPKLEETEPAVLTPVTHTISLNIRGYYKALPSRYHESNEKYPVIICFHGGGQYGNGNSDLPLVLEEGIPKLLFQKRLPPSFTVNDEKFSFIVIAPQFAKQVGNSEIQALVAYVKNSFRVDPSRIYLAGISLGARMLSNYAAYRPTELAAITAMGGMPQIDQNLSSKCSAMANADLPVWQFHNKDDAAWYYTEARRYIEMFLNLKPTVSPRFTSFEVGEGRLHHDCWTRGTNPDYRENGKNIYEWMLGYKR